MMAGGLVTSLMQRIIPGFVPISPFPRDAFEHALRFAENTVFIPRNGAIPNGFSPFNPVNVSWIC
jgi:hypothetical protein